MAEETYKFRLSLLAHKGDVRSLKCISESSVVSGSRDFMVKLWKIAENAGDYDEKNKFLGHTNYVSAITVVNDNQDVRIASGSHDKLIRVFQLDQTKPEYVLQGHTDTVCCLSSDNQGTIVSGSWDKTARIWRDQQCVVTITGHQAAVWCVILMPPVCIKAGETDLVVVTGSADHKICIWQIKGFYALAREAVTPNVSHVATLSGHTDCVRAFVSIDSYRFLSAGNDASIRAWDVRTHECVGEFYAHTNFIYDLAANLSAGLFASAGEDRCVRLWRIPSTDQWAVGRQFSQLQSIPLPCQSAWCVALSPVKCDVFVGCCDGIIRVFTRDSNRQASAEAQQTYEAELASAKIAAPSALGSDELDTDKLPGIEVLSRPGKREGQVIVVKRNDCPVCFQWSAGEARWIEVGDVVGSKSNKATLFEGKEYDFVFTVDIAEDHPPLKLPYNRTEDPWFAAQDFIHRHDLSQQYLETVANFIINNAGVQLTQPDSSNTEGFSDPFTGADRYIPQPVQETTLPNDIGESYFPATTFLTLKSISLKPLLAKLRLFNEQSSSPLSEDLLVTLHQFSFDWSDEQAVRVTEQLLEALETWPIDRLFPLIDILRCLVMWPEASRLIFSPTHWSRLYSVSLKQDDLPTANSLLLLRLITNALAGDGPQFVQAVTTSTPLSGMPSVETIILSARDLIEDIGRLDVPKLKQHQIALASSLHNLSVLAHCCLKSSTPSSPSRHQHEQDLLRRVALLPSLCLRASLSFLALGPQNGPTGVARFHPESISSALICLGTAFLSIPVSTAKDEQEVKNRRILLLASAAYALKTSAAETPVEPEADEDELAGWDRVREMLSYWAGSMAASRSVRQTATQLLHLMD